MRWLIGIIPKRALHIKDTNHGKAFIIADNLGSEGVTLITSPVYRNLCWTLGEPSRE